MKTPNKAPSMAFSKSASAKKILGDLPPSSMVTRFTVSAASLTMVLPTELLPVNAILFTSGCLDNAVPQTDPDPVTMFNTPGGTPTSSSHVAICSAVSGVTPGGFKMQVQPAARAGAIFQVAMSSG